MSYSLAFSQSLFVMLFVASKIELRHYEFISTQQIAQELNIPPSTTGMILRRLNHAGLVETREGANGGIRLARRPEDITILDIFNAVEQGRSLFQTNISLNVTGEKPTRAHEAITGVLTDSESAMKQSLQTVTIRNLLEDISR